MMISEGLSTEVIEHQVLRRNTEIVEHLLDSFTHRAGTTHVVFDVFRSFMVLQISFVNHVVYETCRSRRLRLQQGPDGRAPGGT